MDTITIKILPAKNGDCIVVDAVGELLIIDGGYVSTYHSFLKPEILGYAASSRHISHLIITHIDGDHIGGILKFLNENRSSAVIAVQNIWHNTYRHIQPIKPNPYPDLLKGKDISELDVKNYFKEEGELSGNISAEQGTALGAIILRDNYAWNAPFEGKAICVENRDIITLNSGMTIRLLSPNHQKLEALYKFWLRELYKKGYIETPGHTEPYDDAFEYLLAYEKDKKPLRTTEVSSSRIDIESLAKSEFPEDESPTNGSSISFVLECNEKRLLFLGDAHPALIVQSLERHYGKENLPLEFDVVKVSHHGSIGNTSDELLEWVDSEKFVISTDGTGHGHPDLETIARIINRPADFRRKIFLNYPLSSLKSFNEKSLQEKYNFELVAGDGLKPIILTI